MGMNGAEGGVPCLLAPVSRADGQGKVGEGPSRAVNRLTDKCEWARPLASPGQTGSCSIGEWMGVPLAWPTEGLEALEAEVYADQAERQG